jgi:hypothetical protein
MTEFVFLVEDAIEGGLNARALGESIVVQAETLAELREQVRDAVHCHFDEGASPSVISVVAPHPSKGKPGRFHRSDRCLCDSR